MREDLLAILPRWAAAREAPFASLLCGLGRRSLFAGLARITRGRVVIVDGADRAVFGAPGSLSATVSIRDRSAYRDVLLGGSVGAGEGYMRGAWACDDLVALTRIWSQNLDALAALDRGALRLTLRLGELTSAAARSTRARSRRDIARHYDLSNELFALFLDESMTYSSAFFERDDASLAEAQRAKIERVCRKLDLRPEDHLLEIGTGWGALAIHAAKVHGCRVTTATLSREQHALALARVREAGVEDRVEVLLHDYRDLRGRHDKLVSIEMVEAVGHAGIDGYLSACDRLLEPEGLALLQAITIADQHHARHAASTDFIKEYIFPGSSIPSVTSLVSSATRATSLRLVDLEDLTTHYARTLRLWRERFMAREADVHRLGFDAAFVRMWEFYLAYCEGGFRERYLGAAQLLFAKPGYRPRAAAASPRCA
jgi:cyclopropane-fatty-acyl-phospholipid synthase